LRFSLVSTPEQLREALRRIAKVAGAWAK